MKNFSDPTEQELLALAIALEGGGQPHLERPRGSDARDLSRNGADVGRDGGGGGRPSSPPPRPLPREVRRPHPADPPAGREVRLPRFSGRFSSLQSTSWPWRPACRLRRLSVSGIPGPNATAPDYTNPRCS